MSNILEVGLNRTYSTINAAASAALPNDILLIKPGVYKESVYLTKRLHLRADAPNPQDGLVRLWNDTATPLSIIYGPTSSESIYIEGIEIERVGGANNSSIDITTSNSNLSLTFNRCRLINLNETGRCIDAYGGPGALNIDNCYMSKGLYHIINIVYADSVTISKTELDSEFVGLNGDLTTSDYVTDYTYGYGPRYGDYYVSPYLYYFSGKVYDAYGLPATRTVKAYLSDREYFSYHTEKYQYNYVTSTMSSADNEGDFYMTTTYSGAHDIICEDNDAGYDYNSIIFADVYPLPVASGSSIP